MKKSERIAELEKEVASLREQLKHWPSDHWKPAQAPASEPAQEEGQ